MPQYTTSKRQTEAQYMDRKVSLQSLVVEKYTHLLRRAAEQRDTLMGKPTPVPVVVRASQPVRVPVTRRRRVYP